MTLDRFMEKIMPIPESGCWVWMGGLSNGYGTLYDPMHKKRMRAHRWSYEHLKGSIPDGLVLDHICRVPSCVNPGHLRAVTNRFNCLVGIGPTAINAKRTHCWRGHELSGDNISIRKEARDPDGQMRRCKACQVIRNNERRLKRKIKRESQPNYKPKSPPIPLKGIDERRTHCKHGHEFTKENTIIKDGWRECHMCKLIYQAKYRAKLQALKEVV